MQTDRSTKVLLLLIALALWGNLLKPLFSATPAQAGQGAEIQLNIAKIGGVPIDGSNGIPITIDGKFGITHTIPVKIEK